MSKEIKDAAQQQAEESFNQFMYWMKKGTIISCLFLAVVVVVVFMIDSICSLAEMKG